MAGKILRILSVLMVFTVFSGAVFAQDEQDEEVIINTKKLLENADTEFFPLMGFTQDYTEDQGYVNEFPDPLTLHQYYIYDGVGTDLLMTIDPSLKPVHMTNKRLQFPQYLSREFHASYSVQRTENIPVGYGGICWLRYSTVVFDGDGKESGLIIYPGDRADLFRPVDGEIVYEMVADLSDISPERLTKFDIIRLNGITYVYVNEQFRFSVEDGIKNPVSFEAGSELFQDGNRVHCTFDDFLIKMR